MSNTNFIRREKKKYGTIKDFCFPIGLKKTNRLNYIYNKYKEPQTILCDRHDLEPSPCVYFGIDTQNKFPEYNRGNDTNRLCFSRIWSPREFNLSFFRMSSFE